MDQYIDNRHKEILGDLLANPADKGHLYTTNLERMVNDHPQSGILQVLLARADDKADIKNAAVYFKAAALYKLLHKPESLQPVAPENIIWSGQDKPGISYQEAVIMKQEPGIREEELGIGEEEPVIRKQESGIGEEEPVIREEESGIGEEEAATPQPATQNPVSVTQTPQPEKEYFRQDIDDEIYDEIVGIEDIGFEPVVNVLHEDIKAGSQDPLAYHDEQAEEDIPVEQAPSNNAQDIAIDEEKLILGNIVSADYLLFDKKMDGLRKADDQAQPGAAQQNVQPVSESHDVSRYNDDTLPYSFMWWLDKTRKEHAGSFQPYAQNPVTIKDTADSANTNEVVKPQKRSVADELQQQYYENIFSLTSVNDIEKKDDPQQMEFDHNKKEDVIIERFIHNEPQIRPPAADKLDNENKAKKSAEDQDALVTETLARIYTDQMLYHKAIATYKKLILKFPEKKLYFAAQIEQLEKKTN